MIELLERTAPPARGIREIVHNRRAIQHFFDLLRELVGRDFKLRYKRSLLGIGWSLLNPLAQLLVFSFVFGFILPVKIADFSTFLFIGIIAWNWFQSAVLQAATSIVDNGDLIKQPGFPSVILPIVTVTSHLIHFLLALLILIPMLMLGGHSPTAVWWLLPLVILGQAVLSLGLGYLAASLHVSFRDTQYTIGVVFMLGFYLTPVFYETSSIPEAYRKYFDLNPMVHLLNAYRGIFLRDELPDLTSMGILTAWSLISLVIGFAFFRWASDHFVEEI